MNYYLFPVHSNIISARHQYALNERLTINYPQDMPLSIQAGDRLFLALQTEECLLPYEFSILNSNSAAHTLVICVITSYQQALPLAAASLLLSTSLDAQKYLELTEQQVEAITSLLRILTPTPGTIRAQTPIDEMSPAEDEASSDVIFPEADVLDYIEDYIQKRGYYFDQETLYNYHICLKTRPFVILAGLSGTGKSKLAQLYAEALGQQSHFQRIAVRPNWNDDRYLLGHYNTLINAYVSEPALDFILDAIDNPQQIYMLCLDEMNLAHVEYYFSQFLSAMEEERIGDRRISLLSQRAFRLLQGQVQNIPADITLPANLLFTGTINVDETTQPISDKVIDRSNTIEFFNIELDKIPPTGPQSEPLPISATAWISYRAQQPDQNYRDAIVEINNILKEQELGIGYRVVHEIELYLANSSQLLEPQVAFDLQIKQRILPHVRGTEVIGDMLGNLISFAQNNNFPRTQKRLEEMKNRLNRYGYTSFWR